MEGNINMVMLTLAEETQFSGIDHADVFGMEFDPLHRLWDATTSQRIYEEVPNPTHTKPLTMWAPG